MFLSDNELLPDEMFNKVLLVNDLKHLNNMFDYAIRSDDFSNKHIFGLKLVEQLVNYSVNLTEDLKKSCENILFANSFEHCVTSVKNICRRWFKSVSSALDECTHNSQEEKLLRQKRSSNVNFNTLIPNVNITPIEQTTSKLLSNSTNSTRENFTTDHLINPSLSTFLLVSSLISQITGKKFFVTKVFTKVLNDIDTHQANSINQLEKQVFNAIDKYGDKKTKKKFINASKLLFFKTLPPLNNTTKLENKNSLFHRIK